MRRILVFGANVAVAALMVGFAGCGGGVEEGIPKDLTPTVDVNAVPLQPTRGGAVPGAPAGAPGGASPTATPPKN